MIMFTITASDEHYSSSSSASSNRGRAFLLGSIRFSSSAHGELDHVPVDTKVRDKRICLRCTVPQHSQCADNTSGGQSAIITPGRKHRQSYVTDAPRSTSALLQLSGSADSHDDRARTLYPRQSAACTGGSPTSSKPCHDGLRRHAQLSGFPLSVQSSLCDHRPPAIFPSDRYHNVVCGCGRRKQTLPFTGDRHTATPVADLKPVVRAHYSVP
ncbi:hypothetical protein C8T65DRAFT_31667 [Cerioporus squamosus]|nr:hypothetical protein C8T65DRAFT_31667 [Cerioporus squamosus]